MLWRTAAAAALALVAAQPRSDNAITKVSSSQGGPQQAAPSPQRTSSGRLPVSARKRLRAATRIQKSGEEAVRLVQHSSSSTLRSSLAAKRGRGAGAGEGRVKSSSHLRSCGGPQVGPRQRKGNMRLSSQHSSVHSSRPPYMCALLAGLRPGAPPHPHPQPACAPRSPPEKEEASGPAAHTHTTHTYRCLVATRPCARWPQPR